MSNLINLKIDLAKVDRSRIFKGKNGAEYLDLVCFPTQNGRYGETHFVVQSCSKEERESGVKMPIIGNATERGSQSPQQSNRPQPKSAQNGNAIKRADPSHGPADNDDPPF